MLSKLKDEPNVYALAFHVDYWNGTWVDRFSTAAITARQRGYARTLDSGTYTPELVIAGRTHVLGSDEPAARQTIEQLVHPTRGPAPAVHPQLTVTLRGNDAEWTLDLVVPNTVLVLALTEDGLATTPTAGENAGETLHHDAVVRAFTVLPASASGRHMLAIPADVRREHAKLIAFVQQPSGEVLAASGSPASPKPSSTQ